MEPTTSGLSCQLRAVTVPNSRRRPFLFLTSLKIFQPKISPFLTSLSSFSISLLFEFVDGDGGVMGYRWVLHGGCGCVWGWCGEGLKAMVVMGGGSLLAGF